MQNSPIQLGSISLQDFEVPQSVRFGGRHQLAVHALAGGRRIVERLGPYDDEIQFRGTFSGPAAEARARAFDNLRLSGEIVWLTWETFRRRIIVKSFVADYYSPWWIPYQLSCVVVHQTRARSLQVSSVAALLSADLSAAIAAAAGVSVSLGPLQAALAGPNVSTQGSSGQAVASAAVAATLGVIGSQINWQSSAIAAPIPSTTDPSSMGQAYFAKVSSAASLAALVNVASYVGRIGANINGLSN